MTSKLFTAVCALFFAMTAVAKSINGAPADGKWVASWTTPISGIAKKIELPPGMPAGAVALVKTVLAQPELDTALPNGQAENQSFRMIVRPDIWGATVRVRLSNRFGDRDLRVSSSSIGLQQHEGVLVPKTNIAISFGGKGAVTIPAGKEISSDPVHLPFVTSKNAASLQGRNLAVSFTLEGHTGALSIHLGRQVSYIANQNTGDHTRDDGDGSFPNITNSYYLINELDVLAPADTTVVCAVGDSITDTASSTDGHDGWADDLSQRLHALYGDKVSVVNMGVSGNTVVTPRHDFAATEPLVNRLDHDVLGVSGLTSVVLLEGINDLGAAQSKPEPVIEGYKQIVARLHARGIGVMGATLTSSLWPEPNYDNASFAPMARLFGNPQTDAYRKQVNDFIRRSGTFDSVADMAAATDDLATGALYKNFQSGDYLHPNRAGHQAMAAAIDLQAVMHLKR